MNYQVINETIVKVIGPGVDGKKSVNTGSIISESGNILTCAHGLSQDSFAIVELHGAQYPAAIRYLNRRVDIAILSLNVTVPALKQALPVDAVLDPEIGSDCVIVGFPHDVAEATLCKIHLGAKTRQHDFNWLRLMGSLVDGFSGGPMIINNKVFGIVLTKHDVLNEHFHQIPDFYPLGILKKNIQAQENVGFGYGITLKEAASHDENLLILAGKDFSGNASFKNMVRSMQK